MQESALSASAPIGIFDSGIGGLTVAQAVANYLPHENIIYFGDTAHAPYGDKSASTIRHYCYPIVDFLLSHGCKIILIACNSATAAAYEDLEAYVKDRAILMGVISPVIAYISEHYQHKTIGLIGTKQTVSSKVFESQIMALPNHLVFKALATPLLVPIIEENFHLHDDLVDRVLGLYLNQFSDIDALILGCTHYPVIKANIERFYQGKLTLLEAGAITAQALAKNLEAHSLLNPQQAFGQHQFFVSDLTPAFTSMAARFFTEAVKLQKSPRLDSLYK